jgi:hypothetical protein
MCTFEMIIGYVPFAAVRKVRYSFVVQGDCPLELSLGHDENSEI